MKNIGTKLKNKREENGVSVDEAAEDLKLRPSQIVSLEEGDKDSFKDVLYLKNLIKEYAKYLGLDGEKLVDEFNEYLFDYTSKIPVVIIEKAKNEKKTTQKDVVSPYTIKKSGFSVYKYLFLIIIVILLVVVGYFIFSNNTKNELYNSNTTYAIRR